MKKKIKDLTLEECKKICDENVCSRECCPLYGKGICHQSFYDYEEEDLEQEIEVEEDE